MEWGISRFVRVPLPFAAGVRRLVLLLPFLFCWVVAIAAVSFGPLLVCLAWVVWWLCNLAEHQCITVMAFVSGHTPLFSFHFMYGID